MEIYLFLSLLVNIILWYQWSESSIWEKRYKELSNKKYVSPDPYSGYLNELRIKVYRKYAEGFNVEEGTIRDAFCRGIDWYRNTIEGKEDIK